MIIHNVYTIAAVIQELMEIILLMLQAIPVKIAALQSQIVTLVQIQPIVIISFF